MAESVDMVIDSFEQFAANAEPRLRRAYLGSIGPDRMPDAVAEALAYGWEHWDRISSMTNPIGYLFRVGQSKTRRRKRPFLLPVPPNALPNVEPGLPAALRSLSESQRTAVWLAHGCGWSHEEIGVVLDASTSTVSTHVNRGLRRLREELGVHVDV